MLPLLSLLAVLAVGTAGPTRDLLVVWNRDRSASSAELAAVRASAAARLAALGLARGPSLADAAHLTEPARVRDLPYDPALAWRVTASDGAAAARALTALSADPAVRYAEPIVPRGPCALDHPPDDPLFLDHRQWGLANFGDSPGNPGVAGADIHALAAWARAVGANDLTLAI
ncbi:MAG TPA: hypothetical protein VFK69_00450, partial [Candidatus Eisenbacteria bacterium]|nr:hypothetical protein [Candidatus Eisenbacteria bacterium]